MPIPFAITFFTSKPIDLQDQLTICRKTLLNESVSLFHTKRC